MKNFSTNWLNTTSARQPTSNGKTNYDFTGTSPTMMITTSLSSILMRGLSMATSTLAVGPRLLSPQMWASCLPWPMPRLLCLTDRSMASSGSWVTLGSVWQCMNVTSLFVQKRWWTSCSGIGMPKQFAISRTSTLCRNKFVRSCSWERCSKLWEKICSKKTCLP